MKAKALQLAARLRARGLTASAAAKLVGITAITLEGWQKTPGRGGMLPVRITPDTALARSALTGSTVWCRHTDTGWKRRTWRRRWLYCGSLGSP
jgi:hypothetical protein